MRFDGGVQLNGRASTPDEMQALGRRAAELVADGAVIGLIGGLGAGKTHWTKGLVAGLGSAADVTSPTFGLVHEYQGGRLPVHHLDFYRIGHADELIALGWDEILESDGVTVAEWADKFPEIMPPVTKWLVFSIETDGTRQVIERCP